MASESASLLEAADVNPACYSVTPPSYELPACNQTLVHLPMNERDALVEAHYADCMIERKT